MSENERACDVPAVHRAVKPRYCSMLPLASLSSALMEYTLSNGTTDETPDPFTQPPTPAWSLIELSDAPATTNGALAEHPTLFMRNQMVTLAVSAMLGSDAVSHQHARSTACCSKYHVCS
jgi:hypothetical protein